MIMGNVDFNLLVHDPLIMSDGILFIWSGFRNRYHGTVNRSRAKWLRENRDKWLPVTAAEEAALRAGAEHRVDIGPDSLPRLKFLREEPTNPQGAVVSEPVITNDGSSTDDDNQSVASSEAATARATPSHDEIIIDGRRLFSARRTAAILRKSERTLQRWHGKKYGPPRTKVGSEVFYDERGLSQWIQGH
jgi:hypothetical protein